MGAIDRGERRGRQCDAASGRTPSFGKATVRGVDVGGQGRDRKVGRCCSDMAAIDFVGFQWLRRSARAAIDLHSLGERSLGRGRGWSRVHERDAQETLDSRRHADLPLFSRGCRGLEWQTMALPKTDDGEEVGLRGERRSLRLPIAMAGKPVPSTINRSFEWSAKYRQQSEGHGSGYIYHEHTLTTNSLGRSDGVLARRIVTVGRHPARLKNRPWMPSITNVDSIYGRM